MLPGEETGSLTVEAFLVLPALLFLMVLFLRWGQVLYLDLRDTGETLGIPGQTDSPGGVGFLYGGPPARRIRDADLLIDLGQSIKEKLPIWFPTD